MSNVSKIYWRAVKAGTREFDGIPDSVKDDVRELAKADVEAGKITKEQYESLIGEAYEV